MSMMLGDSQDKLLRCASIQASHEHIPPNVQAPVMRQLVDACMPKLAAHVNMSQSQRLQARGSATI